MRGLSILFITLQPGSLCAEEQTVRGIGAVIERGRLKIDDILTAGGSENTEVSPRGIDTKSYGLRYTYLHYVSGKSNSLEIKILYLSTLKKTANIHYLSENIVKKIEAYRMDALQLSMAWYFFSVGLEQRFIILYTKEKIKKRYLDVSPFLELEIPSYLLTMQGYNPILAYKIYFGEYEGEAYEVGISYLF